VRGGRHQQEPARAIYGKKEEEREIYCFYESEKNNAL
jgi:hypothetical protein